MGPAPHPDGHLACRRSVVRRQIALNAIGRPYVTVYFLRLSVEGADGQGPHEVPPAGAVAAAWARTDREHGVHVPPTDVPLQGQRAGG